MIRRCAVGLIVGVGLACSPSVSDHDNRIFSIPAAVKLSAADLSAAYHTDRGAADDAYLGRVLEVSGAVVGVGDDGRTVTLAGSEAGTVLEISFHEDVADETVTSLTPGQRLMVKCFCQGFDSQVRLKSCVTPDASQ